jgi:hypothetical protein
MKLRAIVVAVILASVPLTAGAFKDVECKAKTNIMITEPGSFERVLALVHQKKLVQARKLVRCYRDKGRGIFIVGAAARNRNLYVPVSTGDCIGETFRAHLMCPGDGMTVEAPARQPLKSVAGAKHAAR